MTSASLFHFIDGPFALAAVSVVEMKVAAVIAPVTAAVLLRN
jgi:hypothetical protein